MKTFIPKHKFNYIKKCLMNLNNAFRTCKDTKVLEVTKSYIQEKIMNAFVNLTEDQKLILDITDIIEPLNIDTYLNNIDQYVYGMPAITAADIEKVFKKEKKLKLPKLDDPKEKMFILAG